MSIDIKIPRAIECLHTITILFFIEEIPTKTEIGEISGRWNIMIKVIVE